MFRHGLTSLTGAERRSQKLTLHPRRNVVSGKLTAENIRFQGQNTFFARIELGNEERDPIDDRAVIRQFIREGGNAGIVIPRGTEICQIAAERVHHFDMRGRPRAGVQDRNAPLRRFIAGRAENAAGVNDFREFRNRDIRRADDADFGAILRRTRTRIRQQRIEDIRTSVIEA